MRREVGNAVARLRGDARLLLASRYREALEARTWFVGPMLFAAGAFDRVLVLVRLRRTVRDPRTVLADRVIALWRGRRRSLTLVRAAVGGTDTLSLSLRGSPGLCAAVTGLWIGETAAASTVSGGDGIVRVVAEVPASVFTGTALPVRVMTKTSSLVVTVPDRTTIANRFGGAFADEQWPPRLTLDADRALVLEGRAPTTRSISHEVAVGITTAQVRWAAPAGSVAELRLVPRDGGAPRVFGGRADPDGAYRAAVDLRALVEAPDASWDASVSDQSDDSHWAPLILEIGANPTLAGLPDPAVVPVRRPDGSVAKVRVVYSPTNQLSLRVEALR